MENERILESIKQSDMILAGLGEDFDIPGFLRQRPEYQRGCETLKEEGSAWLIPAWNEFCMERAGDCTDIQAFERLADLVADKNYFVISQAVNSRILQVFGEESADGTHKTGRLVMPCGSTVKKQCRAGCKGVLTTVTEEDREKLQEMFQKLTEGRFPDQPFVLTGVCPECGEPLILNNVYAENYNEEGYLEQWGRYTKWLQGTLNHRLGILELGVGMRFPTVIRWPFEKIAFYNEKACFYRVNERLYQLTKELAEKGCGIAQNAIDWLTQLC